jgi:methylene-tetrahydrofolate reductase-like protein
LSTRTAPSSSPEPAPGGPAGPRPVRPRLPGWLAYRLQRALAPNFAYRWLAGLLTKSPPAYRAFTVTERAAKGAAFGCRMCGQCTLPVTGYACPETCPKKLRNGPCGGVGADGSCEVFPDTRCVWVVAHERAGREGRVADLLLVQHPVDHRRAGRSAWVSYWRGDDTGLWTEAAGTGTEATRPAAGGMA